MFGVKGGTKVLIVLAVVSALLLGGVAGALAQSKDAQGKSGKTATQVQDQAPKKKKKKKDGQQIAEARPASPAKAAASDAPSSAPQPRPLYETLPAAPPAKAGSETQAAAPGAAPVATAGAGTPAASPAPKAAATPPAMAASGGAPGASASQNKSAAEAKTSGGTAETLGGGPAPSPADRPTSTTIKQPADFGECVRVALVQSPMLVKSALEIEAKRLDVQDAWSSFIPTISINTTYWFRMPEKKDGTTDKPWTISFSTSQWNPILSGFEVKARNEIANMAVLAHLRVISEGIKRLAGNFIQLAAIQDQKDVIRQKLELAKMNVDFYKTRLGMGQATPLDVRIAETRIHMIKAEDEKINTMRAMLMDDVKFILGIPFTHKLELDVHAAKKQILGKFGPADVTEDKVRAQSFDLRMQEYEKRLQQKNIGLSYVKLLPSFGFNFQTVDSLNSSNTYKNQGFPFYPGVNISMPLDYWTKGREIARQYKKLDQVHASTRAKEFELMVSVQKAMSEFQTANADLTLSNSKSELIKLQMEQTEYRHRTGQVDFDKVVGDRFDYFDATQKQYVDQAKREIALLSLKHLAGDLQSQFVDVAAWEK